MCKIFTTSKQEWISGNVQKATGPVSYLVMLSDGSTVRRHIDNIKAQCANNISEEDNSTDFSAFQAISSDTTSNTSEPETVTPTVPSTASEIKIPELVISTRPSGVRRPPKRFDNFVASDRVSDFEGKEM